jgi:hypothetical protein
MFHACNLRNSLALWLIADLLELRFLGLDAIGMGRIYVARVSATRPANDLAEEKWETHLGFTTPVEAS